MKPEFEATSSTDGVSSRTAPGLPEPSHRRLYDFTPVILHSIDESGRLRHVSNKWLSIFGYSREEVIGRYWTDFLTPESKRIAIESAIPTLFRTGRVDDVEYQVVHKNGKIIDILLSSVIPPSSNGDQTLSLTVLQDITDRTRERRAFFEQYERLHIILESINEGVITTDRSGRVEYLNSVAEKLTGWTTVSAKGRPIEAIFRVVDEKTRLRIRSSVRQCLLNGATRKVAERTLLTSKDCREYYVDDSASPLKDSSGKVLGIVLVFRDVTERYRLNEEVKYRATHDSLTGVVNRDEFNRRLKLLVSEATESKVRHALIFIDLDRFKLVNDAVGDAAGDELLKQVSAIIRRAVQGGDVVARLGGDEFAVLLTHCAIELAQEAARKICREIDQFRFQHGTQRFRIGASIGLVPIDGDLTTSDALLQAADNACFAAKTEGRNRVHTYLPTDKLIASHRQDMHWVRRLEQAVDGNEFVLYWQRFTPLQGVDKAVHGEVLLRMVDESGRLVSPGAFLPAAERFHMASRIDRWVVGRVFGWMQDHCERLRHVATISINLSGLSVGDRDFHRYVTELLRDSKFDHRRICFEITETAAITNLAEASSFILKMRQFGIRFALDDFGSGVSSFGQLKNLPVDYLKIDGLFTRDLENDKVNQATIRSILDVARVTGKLTVAEFVETQQAETLLREIGIDYAQGYLRHAPAPLDEIFLATPNGQPSLKSTSGSALAGPRCV